MSVTSFEGSLNHDGEIRMSFPLFYGSIYIKLNWDGSARIVANGECKALAAAILGNADKVLEKGDPVWRRNAAEAVSKLAEYANEKPSR